MTDTFKIDGKRLARVLLKRYKCNSSILALLANPDPDNVYAYLNKTKKK